MLDMQTKAFVNTLQVFIFVVSFQLASSLKFELPANGKRCLKEEIHKHALVKGDYELSDVHGHHTTVKASAQHEPK